MPLPGQPGRRHDIEFAPALTCYARPGLAWPASPPLAPDSPLRRAGAQLFCPFVLCDVLCHAAQTPPRGKRAGRALLLASSCRSMPCFLLVPPRSRCRAVLGLPAGQAGRACELCLSWPRRGPPSISASRGRGKRGVNRPSAPVNLALPERGLPCCIGPKAGRLAAQR
ncbi:uncharacterized protein PFL1_04381 [Pseudozyma flocculosa PF-1]|uniref:Uncharacterized protein n=1 Tax=Pseudozyma flocculosa PF-1 TaxID=1277687 RepID=A0A061H6I0_9BASI|nr:uncharacterized protein PFL1_04381 [Pseudozyma flocculosa PF-1]EPQ28054.1 hypothetical protein PFL1_04381 [Pseudozyma flocculosa PF-1]